MEVQDARLMHDLKLSLQLILSGAKLLRMALEDPGMDAAGYLEMVEASARQMQRMLSTAVHIDGSSGDLRAMAAGDLAARVRAICRRCRPHAEARGVALRVSGNVDSLMAMFDDDGLSRILMNLIDNALRAAPIGGEVRVTFTAMGDRAEVTVSDDGKGIDPERLPLIFLPGETDGGTGWGLPSALACAKAMGGTIAVRSEVGRGSDFTLRLPVAPARAG